MRKKIAVFILLFSIFFISKTSRTLYADTVIIKVVQQCSDTGCTTGCYDLSRQQSTSCSDGYSSCDSTTKQKTTCHSEDCTESISNCGGGGCASTQKRECYVNNVCSTGCSCVTDDSCCPPSFSDCGAGGACAATEKKECYVGGCSDGCKCKAEDSCKPAATSTPAPTATPVVPTATPPIATETPVPGCACDANDSCPYPCVFNNLVPLSTPKCSLSSSLFPTTPSASDKNLWCQRNLRTQGDADGNGVVNTTDYFYYVAAVNGGKIPVIVNPDFNGDGEVGASDRAIIVKTLNP